MVDMACSMHYLISMKANNKNQQGAENMKQFEVGQEYSTRSICDWNCIFSFKVISRTAKRIVLKDLVTGDIEKRGIHMHIEGGQENEACRPFGNYSMCPIIHA